MIREFIHFASKDLKKDIGEIQPDTIKPYWSEGRWSMHELLFYLLTITGPAKVYLSTFSISEITVRAFALAIEDKSITELHCLFDYTIKKNKLNLLYFAGNVTSKIKLAPNHSKVILIENDDWTLSVVGSANMTPNPRNEAGAIFTQKDIFDKYKHHIETSMENGLPCFNFTN